MENMTSYDQAVNLMSKTDLIAPAYFIIGGAKDNEATILTRNQSNLVDAWKLDHKSDNFTKWFLIETNYDHWTQPPAHDNRRDPGINAMLKTTRANLNYDTLLDVMTLQPICNKLVFFSICFNLIT
jgi:acid ceramidase